MDTALSADEVYAEMRRTGRYILHHTEAGVIPTLRKRAKADGLAITQFRDRPRRGLMTRAQMRERPYYLNLVSPSDPTTIVFPDGSQRMTKQPTTIVTELGTVIIAAPAEMTVPCQCLRCGTVYDGGTVHVISRYADCDLWRAPCCGAVHDSRHAWNGAPGQRMGYIDLRERDRALADTGATSVPRSGPAPETSTRPRTCSARPGGLVETEEDR